MKFWIVTIEAMSMGLDRRVVRAESRDNAICAIQRWFDGLGLDHKDFYGHDEGTLRIVGAKPMTFIDFDGDEKREV